MDNRPKTTDFQQRFPASHRNPAKIQEGEIGVVQENEVVLVSGDEEGVGDGVGFGSPLPETCGREKLQRHRTEIAGRVWIPEIWGQEELLKDWIDFPAFSRSLVPMGIMSARKALVEDCWKAANPVVFRLISGQLEKNPISHL